MSNPQKSTSQNRENKRRSEAFERATDRVIAGLADVEARTSREFGKALAAINLSLFAMACAFLGSEPNSERRKELAEEARQIWYQKMLTIGFKSFMTRGKPFGLPFGPYARVTLHHICISLLRGRKRACTLAALDGFSNPRRDPRDAAERRELELDCRDLMERLPPKWQDVLRSIYWDGRSGIETSESMHTSPQTVANWHLRSRRRLGDEFRKRGYWPP